MFLSVGSALDPIEVPGITVEEEVPSQEILIGGQEVTVPGVPSKNVTTPEVHVDHTCLPMGLICVGPATFVPEQHLLTTPGTDNETHSVPELLEENTPSIGIKVVLDDVSGTVDPLGPPSELGPLTLHIPNPFGGDPLPVTVCAEGCPLPVSVGSTLVESGLTVTILVDGEELHSMHLPIRLATGPGEGSHVIHGRVSDADARTLEGEPQPGIPGAIVTATLSDDQTCSAFGVEVPSVPFATATDPLGNYMLFVPCPGEYELEITHPLYETNVAAENATVSALEDTPGEALEGATGSSENGVHLKRLGNGAIIYVEEPTGAVGSASVIITGRDVDDEANGLTSSSPSGFATFPEMLWGIYDVDAFHPQNNNEGSSILVVYPSPVEGEELLYSISYVLITGL